MYTGFGKVLNKIAMHISEETDWQVKCLGWFDYNPDRNSIFPFEVIPTNQRDARDVYGQFTFEAVVQKYQPDVVFGIGDEWMVKHLTESKFRRTYKLVLYVPIDGAPIPKHWTETFKQADVFVAYGKFGEQVVRARDESFPISIIPHGIDTEVFHPIPGMKRVKIIPENAFLIGNVGRNQPRKNIPAFLKMLNLFMCPWIKCFNCGGMSYVPKFTEQKCSRCKSDNFKYFNRKDDVYAYLHCAMDDIGWDLNELFERYDLKKRIILPKDNEVGRGHSDAMMCKFYNMFDVFTLPTIGEGFGLPIMEAMSCGIPCVVTNYSAHLDYCSDVTELINVGYYLTESKSGIERALVDIDDYVMKMERLYYDKDTYILKWGNYLMDRYGITDFSKFIDGKEIRKNLGEAGRKRALEYEWSRILPMWTELFDRLAVNTVQKADEVKIEKV